MKVDSVSRVGSTPTFASALKFSLQSPSKDAGGDMTEVEANRQKFLAEQQKAAEDLQRKQQEQQEKKEREQELDMLERQLKASKEQAEAMEDQFEAFAKCMKIASRIAKGDIVPTKDMKYLAEHEPDLYKQAILMRMPNPKPKKHKSVLGDEEEEKQGLQDSAETGASEGSDGADIAVPEAAPAEGSGEEAAAE